MAVYEPVPNDIHPGANNGGGSLPSGSGPGSTPGSAAFPQRYQPLTLDSSSRIPTRSLSNSLHHSIRSPFVCGACCDSFSTWIGSIGIVFPNRKMVTGYSSGILFSVGWWIFIDGAVYNSVKATPNGRFNSLGFEDWLPGILSTIALLVVNMIDRESLNTEDSVFSGDNVSMKARAIAFFGITVALGSVGGALAILSLKYLVPGLSGDALYLGICIALQNVLIFISSMTLWFGSNSSNEGAIALV